MSKSVGGFGSGGRELVCCGFDIDFRTASGLDLDGDIFAFMFDGERGISGDTAMLAGGAIVVCKVFDGHLVHL